MNYNNLVDKLEQIGIKDIDIDLIKSYFYIRKQREIIVNTLSDVINISNVVFTARYNFQFRKSIGKYTLPHLH